MAASMEVPMMEIEFKPGAHLWFGKERTMWRVLEVDWEQETALLITEREICERAYHGKWENVTWERCDLRAWLNGEYYENTFSDEEKAAIVECELENKDNPKYGTKGGNPTKDKIFLLSIEEAEKYFKDSEGRATGSRWWLRSPGNYCFNVAYVDLDGGIDYGGDGVINLYVNNVNLRNGVRPALKINLESDLFQSFIISKSSHSIIIKSPVLHIRAGKIISTSTDIQTVEIPEGVTELGETCFAGITALTSVKLPSTLKKIGKEAFSGCENLQEVSGTNGAVSYGKDVFSGCKKLQYTPEMFRNTGKLCDSFAEHLSACGAEEISWLLMYQKGPVWEKKLPEKITEESAPLILKHMTEHIGNLKKSPKKPAEAAAAFAVSNSVLMPSDGLKAFCDVLREKKLGELADALAADPAVAARLSEDRKEDSAAEQVMPDGSIRYGVVEEKPETGAHFPMGKSGVEWRILEKDRDAGTALVIADESVCQRAYHDKNTDITWEKCDLRAWLNGEYYENTFSDAEKAAIIECELENKDNPKYGTKGGNPTKDRIFLLSIEEAEKYFIDSEDRATGSWWWLRSPGLNRSFAAGVYYDGDIYYGGDYVYFGRGVRPAFKINLQSEFFQSILSTDQNGEAVIRNPQLIIKAGEVISAYHNVTEVTLPAYVKKIAARAFRNCTKLTSLTWQGKRPAIDEGNFANCPLLRLPAELYCDEKLPRDNFARYLPADPAAIANILLKTTNEQAMLQAAVDRLSEENASAVADEILKQAEKGKGVKDPGVLARFILAVTPVAEREKLEALIKCPGAEKLPPQVIDLLKTEAKREKPETPVIGKKLFYVSDALLAAEFDKRNALPGLSPVLAACGDYAAGYGRGLVEAKEYKKGALAYTKNAQADTLAASMDHAALMEQLKCWQQADGDRWLAPYAAFADDGELEALLGEMKAWEKDKALREKIIRVRGAILLNDTVTAMRYADGLGLLERYAQMRGTDADTLRDETISDFGLDENGKRSWSLAGRELTAVLNPDLTITLLDADGKALKTVPKKGAAPEEYEAVNREFTAIKKAVKPTAKTRNDKIFADFLSGRERSGADWKRAYLKNPLLRMLARLIVWEQSGNTFILDEAGLAHDADGNAYTVTDEPVRVAHPMEMSAETVEAWQKYFTESGLKQPFEQVWEPVANASLVKPGRYDGCTVPQHMLMNKEKHGIIMEGQSRITLIDCTAGLKLIEGHHDWYNNEFEITDFRFERYTRQVNHIVVHLDKGTVAGRVKKDDTSAAQWFDRFTLAQITEFIRIAQEAQAVNVLALLLEYKNNRFADFDPMDEFTLEW